MRSIQFNGTFMNKIDPKGRMSVAVELRDKLKKREEKCEADPDRAGALKDEPEDGTLRLVLTKGLGARFIWCLPIDVWDRKVERLNSLPNTEKAQMVRRHLVGGAHECEIDKLGRILISPALREYAGLGKGEAVVNGMGETFEIWSKERHASDVDKPSQEKLVQEYVAELGI
jgi:MraZ protein